MAQKRTYVKRVLVGRPVASINQAASGVVSGTGRQVGNILVNSSATDLFEPATLQGGHMIVTSHNTSTNDINIAIDSSELNTFIDSALSDRIGGPFVDSAYVEQNSLDSERGLNVINTEFGQLSTSLIPQTDSSIDLGSSTKKFRKLFLSGNTIKLGTLNLSDSGGNFVVRDSDNNNTKLDLSANSTNDLIESDNLYYTRARFDSALGDTTSRGTIRGYINLVDAGGDGSLTYDSAGGKITYTGPSAAEVRAHLNGGHGIVYSTSTGNISVDSSEIRGLFSAGGDLTYNSGTGQFTFDVESVYTQANFESDLSLSLNATNGIAYDSASHKLSLINTGVDSGTYGSATRVPVLRIQSDGRVDSAGSVLVAGVTGFSLDSASGVLTISTADGGSFSAPIHSRDSAELFEISGSSINYDSGSINQFTATNITADSAVITDVSGTTLNYTQAHLDSAVAVDISGTTLNYSQAHLDSARVLDISGTTANFVSGNIGQFDADSARATNFTAATATIDSARAINISGTGLNYTTAHLANISGDSAKIGNMTITGDLTVSGTQTTINTTTVKVHDPIIHLADSNEISDIVDIGFVGKYYRDGQQRHTGLVRDASNEQYYLFRDVVDSSLDSSLTINRSATGFAKADINLANLLADSATLTNITADSAAITDISGVTLNYNLVHAKTATLDSATLTNLTVTGVSDISRAPTVDSGTYGSATLIPQITVNTSGFIDSIGTVAVASISSTTWDSSTGEYTISTADGGSFKTAIRGFGDNVSLAFGNDDDATIIRNPTNLVIKDSNGGIYLEAEDIYLSSKNNGNPIWLQVGADDGVKLNDSTGNLILKTRKYGVELNGSITGDSADFDIIRIGGKVIQSHIDSAYIELNSLDSERTIALIDSDYIRQKVKVLEGNIIIQDSDNSASDGPDLILRRNSATPADNDNIGAIQFEAKDDGDNNTIFANIFGTIDDASNTTEDGAIIFGTQKAGSLVNTMKLDASKLGLINGTSLDVAGTITVGGELLDSSFINLRAKELSNDELKLTLANNDATAGPTLILDRNSSSAADSDALAAIDFRGRNDAGTPETIAYAKITSHIQDMTDGSEDGELKFSVIQAGADIEKFALTSRGFELGTNQRLYFQGDSGDLYLHNASTGSHNLLLPDSSGTILTRDFVFNLIDSAYIGARQSSTGLTLDFDDSAGATLVSLTITQAATILTGSPIGFGNTITVLDTDSAEVTISL